MLGLAILSAIIAFASLVSSTGILIPLYVWPEDDTTWEPVYTAVAAHPDILFQVIINPDSGPGDSGMERLVLLGMQLFFLTPICSLPRRKHHRGCR